MLVTKIDLNFEYMRIYTTAISNICEHLYFKSLLKPTNKTITMEKGVDGPKEKSRKSLSENSSTLGIYIPIPMGAHYCANRRGFSP